MRIDANRAGRVGFERAGGDVDGAGLGDGVPHAEGAVAGDQQDAAVGDRRAGRRLVGPGGRGGGDHDLAEGLAALAGGLQNPNPAAVLHDVDLAVRPDRGALADGPEGEVPQPLPVGGVKRVQLADVGDAVKHAVLDDRGRVAGLHPIHPPDGCLRVIRQIAARQFIGAEGRVEALDAAQAALGGVDVVLAVGDVDEAVRADDRAGVEAPLAHPVAPQRFAGAGGDRPDAAVRVAADELPDAADHGDDGVGVDGVLGGAAGGGDPQHVAGAGVERVEPLLRRRGPEGEVRVGDERHHDPVLIHDRGRRPPAVPADVAEQLVHLLLPQALPVRGVADQQAVDGVDEDVAGLLVDRRGGPADAGADDVGLGDGELVPPQFLAGLHVPADGDLAGVADLLRVADVRGVAGVEVRPALEDRRGGPAAGVAGPQQVLRRRRTSPRSGRSRGRRRCPPARASRPSRRPARPPARRAARRP